MSTRTIPPASEEKLREAVAQDNLRQAIRVAYDKETSTERVIYFFQDCADKDIEIPDRLKERTKCAIPSAHEATSIPQGMILTHDRFSCPVCGAYLVKVSQVCAGCFADITYKKYSDCETIQFKHTLER